MAEMLKRVLSYVKNLETCSDSFATIPRTCRADISWLVAFSFCTGGGGISTSISLWEALMNLGNLHDHRWKWSRFLPSFLPSFLFPFFGPPCGLNCSNAGSLTHCVKPGIKHVSRCSRDADNPLAPQQPPWFLALCKILCDFLDDLTLKQMHIFIYWSHRSAKTVTSI